jgi:hypothetical protein
MRPLAPVSALILLLAACGGGGTDVPAGPDTTGTWTGNTGAAAPSLAFAFTLQDKSGSLSGTGKVKGPATTPTDSASVTVTGEKRFRTVTLTFAAPSFLDLTFNGILSAQADSATGTLTGSGVAGTSIVLHHTP